MIPADHLWPIDSVWNYHCGRHEFNTLKRYNAALFNRLGEPSGVDEYCTKAQFINYEGMRAMYEAFAGRKHNTTGIIQWMLNASWPKLWWQLYDYYLMPNGAFYGAKKALEPEHIEYDYSTRTIVAVNNTMKDKDNLTAKVRVLNFDLTEKFKKEAPVSLKADEVKNLFAIPELQGLSTTYFLELKLVNKSGKIVSNNLYTLSTVKDVLDNQKTEWFVTPTKEYADLKELNKLPEVSLTATHSFTEKKKNEEVEVKLVNNSSSVAYQIELMVTKGENGESVLPIFWDDNYFSLFPGEEITIKGHFAKVDLDGAKPVLKISGWNVKAQ